MATFEETQALMAGMLETLIRDCDANLKRAYDSGALSGDEPAGVVARAVILITAKNQGRFVSREAKWTVNNLEKFI